MNAPALKPALAIIAAVLLAPIFRVSAADSARPNIVVLLADDLGWGDTSPYGNSEIKTPNLARLAAQGVKFNQCYSAAGVCSPSRSAILTGRTPYRNGVWQHLSGDNEAHLRASEITYPRVDRTQLFDLASDPLELTNLADQPRHAAKLAELTSCVILNVDRVRTEGDSLVWKFDLRQPGSYVVQLVVETAKGKGAPTGRVEIDGTALSQTLKQEEER